jgi:hypothetical protein
MLTPFNPDIAVLARSDTGVWTSRADVIHSIPTSRHASCKTGAQSHAGGSVASNIQFPNGNGHGATLSISPPTNPNDPWQGVALYQDPALANSVNDSWGPGATLNVDGVAYLPNANVTISGNASSGNAQCTKFVTNQFTTNGSVNLNFSQSDAGCSSLNVKQFAGSSAYLLR